MKDPIKIIHKFKNNNKNIQYKVYIFIGSLVPKNIITILESINNKDFYTTLNTLSKSEYQNLEDFYGQFWYDKFFISYHVKNQRQIINNTNTKKKAIETKFGKEWYKTHIIEPPVTKVSYSYASLYYNNLLLRNKIKAKTRKVEMDFRTYNIEGTIKEQLLVGGKLVNDDEEVTETIEENANGEELPKIEEIDDNNEPVQISEEDFEEQVEEDFNLEELSKLYSTVDTENNKNIIETSKLISAAINDKKWDKKIEHAVQNYDNSLENINYDAKLEDIYNKYYVTEQYIFKDDTIKNMRNKIALSIPVSDKFGKSIKFLPETQYFWSEYDFENKQDQVMLGQKWVRRNELLKIDIKPNENIKVYEKLRNNLSYLKDSFGHKIKREDDEANIIRSYENFVTNNEIFMLDVYNELGINYNVDIEEKRNLYDVYINIYFPLISYERLEQIIQLLIGKNDKEIQYIEAHFGTLRNDTKLETEIENTVEKAKLDLGKFNKLFAKNHIIFTTIHVNISNPKNITGTVSENKFNLYRIFDNFIVNSKYPFIQYQTPDSQLTYKFYTQSEKIDNQDLLTKWFETAPQGISFKIKLDNNVKTENKYISINLHENGRIDYKITWKEDDEATVDDITDTYNYVRDLLKKINSENKKIKFILPSDDRFKYAFINTIQKFTIPENFKINHNDLSEFARFFYPYVSLVIEPKKRVSKKQEENKDSSKYGTYLRYKRISKFDNKLRMHMRILYFLRNYELTDRELLDEISKQFNITTDIAAKELDYVREKYNKVIKKSKRVLKKLKTLPKSKPPGIGIDIQGRDKERYKIRITGARTKEQLDDIIDFIKVLIYLYVETYLYKKKEFQKLKETLKNLNKIARRRNKVIEVVDYDTTIKTVKSITSLDKARLGFKPEKGQNQWTRSCQNSGSDKKRRPTLTPAEQLEQLIKQGYKLNKTTGFYEKEVKMFIRKKEYTTTIKAVKLPGENNSSIYYTCDPSENKKHIYIGFLARGNNPNDLCMPCCFKKDHMKGANKEKRDYFLKCIGNKEVEEKEDTTKTAIGEKIYILQNTNKIQEGRFISLPKYLEIFFNNIWNHDQKIKNHYLLESKSGYFYKYTVKHDYYHFLIAIANIYNIGVKQIIEKLYQFIENDKSERYFNYLNNGDICETFKTRANFIEYIKSSNYLEYDLVGELLAIPGVISAKGINYYIFNKKTQVIKKALEKEKIKEKYYLDCLNTENYNQLSEDRDIIILIKENKYYFPVYRVQKDERINKKIVIEKYFSQNGPVEKIITELKEYHNKSCRNSLVNKNFYHFVIIAKNIIDKLISNNIEIKKQIIDDRHKCKYLELNNNLYLPVKPSGISYNYPFTNVKNIKSNWQKLTSTIKLLENIENILKLDYIPNSVYYDKKTDSKINIISILLENGLVIPIVNEVVDEKEIKKLALSIKFQPLEETINYEITNWDKQIINDNRIKNIREHNYISESYNLYRLELSLFLSENEQIKEKIISIVRNNNINLSDKKHELRKILLDILDSKLADQYKLFNNKKQSGGSTKSKTMAHIVKTIPNLTNYSINNVRDYCEINNNQNKCSTNLNCLWKDNSCKIQLLEDKAIDFVNRVIEEMIQDNIKFKEIIQEGTYYVSDIVDTTQFTNRDSQKIIKLSNFNIQKLMSELFGKDKIPSIGKKQLGNFLGEEDNAPELIELGKQFIQIITPNKDSIIRAYVNSYYWINNPLYDIESRNLGYFSELQTNLTYLFKADIIDFIQTNIIKGTSEIKRYLEDYFKNEYLIGDKNNMKYNFFDSTLNKFRKTSFNTDGKVELFILSHLISLPIVVYDNYSNVKYIFMQGEVKVNSETIKNYTSEKNINKTIFLKFDYDSSNTIPKNIYSIYYF
jgi:hypothetical protein